MKKQKQFECQGETLKKLINNCKSIRGLARLIGEDSADIGRWKLGYSKIHMRACLKIIKLFGVKPCALRPDIFDENVEIVFKKETK